MYNIGILKQKLTTKFANGHFGRPSLCGKKVYIVPGPCARKQDCVLLKLPFPFRNVYV